MGVVVISRTVVVVSRGVVVASGGVVVVSLVVSFAKNLIVTI